MDNRKWQANAKAGAPTVPASPSSGFPGNGGVGDPPTTPGDWWYHQIGEELRSVIVAAALTPTHNLVNQLLAALNAGWGMAKSLGQSGYITLPGGLIFQWGTGTTSAGGSVTVTLPITYPNQHLMAFATDLADTIGNMHVVSVFTTDGTFATNTIGVFGKTLAGAGVATVFSYWSVGR